MNQYFKGVKAVSIALSASVSFGVFANNEVLNIYNWAEYMPMNVIKAFEKEYDVSVNYSTFENNESMYTKLKLLNGKGYDLVFASTYFIQRMSDEGMLAKIDKSKIPHVKDIIPALMGQPFDKNNDYSLPYIWGVTGISYNSELVDGSKVTKWSDLWKPEFSGQLMLLDDVRDVFGMALKAKGYSINSRNENEIKEAYNSLVALRPSVVLYNSDAPHVPFVTGEIGIGQQWNGNAYLAKTEMDSIHFIYPKEGSIMWMDNFIIPKNAEKVDLAHKFIDFMYRPENQAAMVEELGYPAPSKRAKEKLSAKYTENNLIFPTDDDLKNSEFTNDIGEAASIYNRYWQLLKS